MSLTVITGPMWSWKTSELIRRVQRAEFAKKRTLAYKPSVDDRYHKTQITAHDGTAIEASAVKSLYAPLFNSSPMSVDLIAVDEVQFFDDIPNFTDLVALKATECDVIMCGLDMDFRGRPFAPTAALMAIADQVVKLTSICAKCGADAIHTQRVNAGREVTSGDIVQVGGVDTYEPRCRNCFVRE